MRFRLSWMAIGAACSSHALVAGNVEIAVFDASRDQPVPFVLTTARSATPASATEINSYTASPASLASDFMVFASGQQQQLVAGHRSRSEPTNSHASIRKSWQRGPTPQAGLSVDEVAYSSYQMCGAQPYLPNPALSTAVERRRGVWYRAMADAACSAGVPVLLLDGMIVQESGYNPVALSPKGAASLAQLMPDRARMLGVANIWDPAENLAGGARYLRVLLDEFGRYDLALAAYNAGENRVRGTLQVPRIKETIHYVSSILLSMRDQLARRAQDR